MKLLTLALWLVIALWAVPVVRWVRFAKWSAGYLAETSSINASNDLNYATSVGIAYLVGLGCSALLCWRMNRRASAVNWTLWNLCLAVLAWVIRAAPEEPIVLFPSFSPLRCGLWFAGLGTVALAAWFDDRPRLKPAIQSQLP